MDDYLKRQQELLLSIEDSTGIRSLRNMEEVVRQTLEPFRSPYMDAATKMFADMQRQQSLSEQLLRSVSTANFTHSIDEAMRSVIPVSFRSLTDVMAERNEQYQTYLGDAVYARAESFRLLTKVGQDIAAFGAVPLATKRLMDEIQGISTTAAYLRPESSAVLATAMRGWEDILSSTQESGTFAALANPLFEVAHEMRHTTGLLARTEDPDEARTLDMALAIGDMGLRAGEDLVRAFEPDGSSTEDVPPRRLAAPRRHRIELSRVGEALQDLDIREALTVIPSGQIALIASELLVIVSDINYTCQLAGSEVIFTPTVRLQRVAAELPFALANSGSSFAEIIDDLFWLLCEAAGSAKPRFLVENGGVLSRDESEIVFVIKRLRNHLRHDPEHGSEREIAKKYEHVLADLAARGFTAWPRTRAEYTAVQRVLLEEAAAFGAKLRDRL